MEKYVSSFKLILHAGNSKANSVKALELCKNQEFEKAELLLKEAKEELIIAHKEQTILITEEATGSNVQVNMLLVHAQDHISGAAIYIHMAEQILELRKEIQELRKV